MGNKTIYVADEKVWTDAKKLAGKAGLSSVVAKALQEFVASRRLKEGGFERRHFEIFEVPEDGPSEVIAFDGKELVSDTFDLVLNPFEGSDSDVRALIRVYRTPAGTFILLAAPVTDEPESESAFARWEKHSSLKDLMAGDVVGTMFPPNRHDLLKKLSEQLGKDSVTWIE